MKCPDKRPWWWPVLVDEKLIAELRQDYPEKCDGLDDDEVLCEFDLDCTKYADTWDHLGDARGEYEQLADAFLEIVQRADALVDLVLAASEGAE